jgi:citrate synthase
MDRTTHVQSRIWLEEPEPDDAFACRAAYCHGFDVYGDMLGNAGFIDMLYLLFKGEAPSRGQRDALDLLAVALANPGPREASVHAAMSAGVGGSPAASALMAALAIGAGGASGSRELFRAMQIWDECGTALGAWQGRLSLPNGEGADGPEVWPAPEHPAGFDPLGVSTRLPVRQTLAQLVKLDPGSRCAWLEANLAALEEASGHPLSLVGVAAAAFADLGLSAEQGEMLFLLLRLPGAAAHALEQQAAGHKQFPFYQLELDRPDPGAAT